MILTPRTNIDREMVVRYGNRLHLADSARARTPTRVSVRDVVFEGDTVVSVYIDNKAEGRDCYFRHRIVLGKTAGSTMWKKVLGAQVPNVCEP